MNRSQALELLPDLVLGTLEASQAEAVELLLSQDAELQAEYTALQEDFGCLPASLPPVSPSPRLKERLLESVSKERFAPFAFDLAKYFDLAVEKVREILGRIDDPEAWEMGFMPGVALMHFAGGPQAVGADNGLGKFPPGFHFPFHRHDGPEVMYILQGGIRDSDGKVYTAGMATHRRTDDPHEYQVLEEEELIFAVSHTAFDIIDKDEI